MYEELEFISSGIRLCRQELNLTQKDLSRLSGVSASTISAIELQDREIKLGLILDILDVLNLELYVTSLSFISQETQEESIDELDMRRIRKEKDLCLEELAELLNCSARTVREMERDKNPHNIKLILKWLRLFDKTLYLEKRTYSPLETKSIDIDVTSTVETLCKKLRNYRCYTDIKRIELCKACGMSRTTLTLIEQYKTIPTLEYFTRLAKYLDLRICVEGKELTVRTLRSLRKNNKLKQYEIADRLDLSRCTISYIESGKLSPRLTIVEKWLNIFGRTMELQGATEYSSFSLEQIIKLSQIEKL